MDGNGLWKWSPTKAAVGSWLSITGFALVLIGPLLLYAAQFVCDQFGYTFSETGAGIYAGICAILPCAGFLLALASLFWWKHNKRAGRALGLTAVLVGNPLFLYVYIFICAISARTLANLPWM